MTGTRRGEALGLGWEQVDDGKVEVERQLAETGDGWELRPPKRPGRSGPLTWTRKPTGCCAHHRQTQREQRLLVSPAWRDSGLVFCDPTGAPLVPTIVSMTFATLVRRAGLSPIRLHDLRHTHASC